jgi:hypothetical protein
MRTDVQPSHDGYRDEYTSSAAKRVYPVWDQLHRGLALQLLLHYPAVFASRALTFVDVGDSASTTGFQRVISDFHQVCLFRRSSVHCPVHIALRQQTCISATAAAMIPIAVTMAMHHSH